MIQAIYLIDEFVEPSGIPTMVLADVKFQYDPENDRDIYLSHKGYFARLIAPNTFYAYESIRLDAGIISFDRFLENTCPLKGARLYVSTNAE